MARIHGITEVDTNNTYWGMATTIYFNHCPHHCIGCFNPETWEKDDSLEVDNDEIVERLLTGLDKFMKKDLTLLGGEPFSPFNQEDVMYIVGEIKKRRPETRILSWTGYQYDYLRRINHPLLQYVDILIDGRFIQDLQVSGHLFGSSNQRVIDVQKSLKSNEVTLAPEKFRK